MNTQILKNWKINDPDNVLGILKGDLQRISDDNFESAEIYPREDLIQCRNKKTGIILDLGFYGCEVSLEGIWIVYVISSDLDWENPISKEQFTNIIDAKEQFKEHLFHYRV